LAARRSKGNGRCESGTRTEAAIGPSLAPLGASRRVVPSAQPRHPIRQIHHASLTHVVLNVSRRSSRWPIGRVRIRRERGRAEHDSPSSTRRPHQQRPSMHERRAGDQSRHGGTSITPASAITHGYIPPASAPEASRRAAPGISTSTTMFVTQRTRTTARRQADVSRNPPHAGSPTTRPPTRATAGRKGRTRPAPRTPAETRQADPDR